MGDATCNPGGRPQKIPGSFGHYQQDIDTFAKWKVDYIKVDWCGGHLTDPQAQRTPLTCGAVISDGSGVHALSGTDTISIQAPAGNRVGITVEDLYLPTSQYLRVLSADGSVLAEIRGQELQSFLLVQQADQY